MNGRSQMQGGKNWIFPKKNKCKLVLLGLSLAGNLEKQLMSPMDRMAGALLWT
jgi:hypothetical protein